MAKIITGSPDISTLDFNILYDLSGATPQITLTNESTGPNLAACSWWVTAYTPSNTPIHIGSQASPDLPTQAWTSYTIPDAWPTPLSQGLCAQVEFSCATPYVVTLYVVDAVGNVYSYAISTAICAPNGVTENTCGNWGAARFNLEVMCSSNPPQVAAQDVTNYIYNAQAPNTAPNQSWEMVYPKGATGNPIPPATATNTASVLFPIYYVGEGYAMYLNTICEYTFGEATIKIQYKSQNAINAQYQIQKTAFAVWCNIDTCKLQCEVHKYLNKVKRACNTIENAQYQQNLSQITALYVLILDATIHPLCGVNPIELIKEIERIGEFSCDCCNRYPMGVNLSGIINTGGSSSTGCCPTESNIINKSTGISPTNCAAGGYFPASIYDPTGTTVIGTATDMTSLISILNANAAWEAYGTAFNMGNCQVGWYAATAGTIIPVILILPTGTTIISSTVAVSALYQLGSSVQLPPVGCPGGNPYPLRIYDPTGTTIIGIANSITDVVNLLNTTASWMVYGTASVQDSCHAQWNLNTYGQSHVPPNIPTDINTTSTTCVNGQQAYTVNMVDACQATTAITAASFPCNVSVNFGLGAGFIWLGQVANNAAMIAALNAASSKPASVTFSATSTIGQVEVTNTNCTAYSGTITVQCDAGSADFLLFGANHTDDIGTTAPTLNAEYGIALRTNSVIGKIPGSTLTNRLWHTIQISNYIIACEANTGKVFFWDITNPLMPSLAQTIQLNSVVSGNFSGYPHSANNFCDGGTTTPLPSWYSLYFPTDYYSAMALSAIYIFEGTTGTAWEINFYTGAVVASFQSNLLLGKCPRVLIGGKLYFTQDGSLEQDASLSSGVNRGNILQFNIAAGFNSGNLSQLAIFDNQEWVWAASYDGTQFIYFTGQSSSVVVFSPLLNVVDNTYLYVLGAGNNFINRLNSCYFQVGPTTGVHNAFLYWTSVQIYGFNSLMSVDVYTLSTTPAVVQFQSLPTEIAGSGKAHNFLPLGNCLGVLTTNHQDPVSGNCANGIVAIYNLNGTYVGQINLSAGQSIYNLIAVPDVSVYTPTNMS